MSNSSSSHHNDFFSSLISDIKTYTGNDPLLPWLRGVRKIKESLPPQLLREKLPRFLQKCAQTFESDRRYKNDLRYLRVWLQLMDFVDDPRAVLKAMETNCIGMKKALFYQAYALYYEKLKKFEEADKIYHLGVQNLAEPIDELQKSYEQFLHRTERHKKKKIQRQERATKGILRVGSIPPKFNDSKQTDESSCEETVAESDVPKKFFDEDTVVVRRLVDTAIVGKAEAEDACHHGLVEPTMNTKEALNAINNMFREPLEREFVNSRSLRSQPKVQGLDKGFEVFVDESLNEAGYSNQRGHKGFTQEPLQIFIDDGDERHEMEDRITVNDDSDQHFSHVNALVFPSQNDIPSERYIGLDSEISPCARFREDTVVCRFVGAAISEEPQVENVCHNGLVEPTINLKEAMDDINSMFGKPIDFGRTTRRKKEDKAPSSKNNFGGFLILPDDDIVYQHRNSRRSSTVKNESDLFEPTMCTKQAQDEINKMFGMPLDF